MTTDVFTSGSGTFTVPDGVTSVQISLNGAGGGGGQGGDGTSSQGAAGGGGGGFLIKTLSVSPGDTITWSVGAGGAGTVDPVFGCASGGSGSQSSCIYSGVTYAAYGGTGGYSCGSGTVGLGGSNTGNGDSQGSGSNGAAKTGNGGGVGGAGGGAGGTAGTTSTPGGNGTAPGGGGGGGGRDNSGGNGADGAITFTYTASGGSTGAKFFFGTF